MGFKTGLLVGFGAGYVMGSKAGRERYEEIRRGFDRMMGNPQVQRVAERGKDVVESGAKKSLRSVQEGVGKATGAVKNRLSSEDSATDTMVPPPGPVTGPATAP